MKVASDLPPVTPGDVQVVLHVPPEAVAEIVADAKSEERQRLAALVDESLAKLSDSPGYWGGFRDGLNALRNTLRES